MTLRAFLTGVFARHALAAAIAALLSVLVAGCAPAGPRALVAGTDECGYCRMTISDVRFGAQAIARTGKITTFDAVECLAGYAAAAGDSGTTRYFVADFEHPGTWLPADSALYVSGAAVHSPMGRSLLALAPHVDRAIAARTYGGTVRDWATLVAEARGRVAGGDAVGDAHAAGHAHGGAHAHSPHAH
ncbi:MAG: nitrous oxide reductase accessory protein NosL [Gemmatimonadaceae bacterium]|jgi:copper chaperone NosL|nr:nitrous oxide reductase accessory protein NosL [Gemmatimonadaceae bacterium]